MPLEKPLVDLIRTYIRERNDMYVVPRTSLTYPTMAPAGSPPGYH